jgi:ABC-2 type transport system ATP-binding protein
MSEPVVRVQNLVKRYPETTALDGVSFEVQPAEVFTLLGPNGAGKTTTVEILEGVRQPTAGKVTVLGVDLSDGRGLGEERSRIGVLPQDFNAFARLTVKENLEFFAGIYDNRASVSNLLDLFGLLPHSSTRFSRLSGGLKQRVGVAAALINDPELVFLDEPTTGLDPEVRRSTWGIIKELGGKKKTVILTTHYMEEAQLLSDRIGILVKGKIAALDTPAGLLNKFGGPRAIVFRNGGDSAFGTLRRFFDTVSMEGSDVVLPFEGLRDLEVALTALVGRGLEPEISLRSPTIEEVFLRLAGFGMSESGEAS